MKTIKELVQAQIVEKKSKFISLIYPVSSVDEAETKIKEIKKKYYDARHHCYAYRIYNESNIIEKSSDDGEPSGTAGAPMLNLLAKNDLINALIVVIRYFGGILLGTGGLVRAYTQSSQDAILNAKTVNIKPGVIAEVKLPYQQLNNFKHYCQKNNINIISNNYNEEVTNIIEIPLEEKERIIKEVGKSQLDIKSIKIIKATYIQENV